MKHKLLILGGTGMLGHVLLDILSQDPAFEVHATVRASDAPALSRRPLGAKIHTGIDAENFDSVRRVISSVQPHAVINCIGIIKQLPASDDPLCAIQINALLPHRIARACEEENARLIHISTDCVFDGLKGNYREDDVSNATDMYGRSKFLGEVNCPNCLTLRTSFIGHELKTKLGLLEWFLSQEEKANGYTNVIYTGFPTAEFARIMAQFILPDRTLQGVFHVSSERISKHELLKLVADRYGKKIEIIPSGKVKQDRSLDSSKFRPLTGYHPPSWPELVAIMHSHFINNTLYNTQK